MEIEIEMEKNTKISVKKPILLRCCTTSFEQCPTIFNLKKHEKNEIYNFNSIKRKNIRNISKYIEKHPDNKICFLLFNNFKSDLFLKNDFNTIYNSFIDIWNKNVIQDDYLIKIPKKQFTNIIINDDYDYDNDNDNDYDNDYNYNHNNNYKDDIISVII